MANPWLVLRALHRPSAARRRANAHGTAQRDALLLWAALFLMGVMAAYATGRAPRGAIELIQRLVEPLAAIERAGTPVDKHDTPSAAGPTAGPTAAGAEPQLIINRIGIEAPIVFPAHDDFELLNAALTTGIVHYPGSSLPGTPGNVFLFGHSTGLPVVHNRAFAVFNRLKDLEPGDTIRIRYGGREHWYRAERVTIRTADAALVDLTPRTGERLLTLSTCRIFGGRDDRYVVEAKFMKSYPVRKALSASDPSS